MRWLSLLGKRLLRLMDSIASRGVRSLADGVGIFDWCLRYPEQVESTKMLTHHTGIEVRPREKSSAMQMEATRMLVATDPMVYCEETKMPEANGTSIQRMGTRIRFSSFFIEGNGL